MELREGWMDSHYLGTGVNDWRARLFTLFSHILFLQGSHGFPYKSRIVHMLSNGQYSSGGAMMAFMCPIPE